MKKLSLSANDFIKCGVTGWCMEVIWTGAHSFFIRDFSLAANTSLLMFPIYSLAAFIKPISSILKVPAFVRGLIYTALIFAVEFISGTLLSLLHICPWNYNNAKYNINGLIRLDYAPAWFSAGLLFEKLLNPVQGGRHADKK